MIFGYTKKNNLNEYGLSELREVSFRMSAEELENMAKFFTQAAEDTKAGKLRPGYHMHIDSCVKGWDSDASGDVIVIASAD